MYVVLTSQVGWEEADYIHCDPQLGDFKCSLMFITVNIFVITPCIYLPDFYLCILFVLACVKTCMSTCLIFTHIIINLFL